MNGAGHGDGEASPAAVTGEEGGPGEEEQEEAEEGDQSVGTGRGTGPHANGGDGGHAGMEPTSAIKLLVSAGLAGCLIGKAGATINELQERTGARIKLSQNNDYFPGAVLSSLVRPSSCLVCRLGLACLGLVAAVG